MEQINLVYIDDEIDLELSDVLENYSQSDVEINYEEIRFELGSDYETLLSDVRIRESNIILIDSQLFTNKKATNGKYTGEQFRLILRKIFPYIEVIVITQNDVPKEYSTITKYHKNFDETAEAYYKKLISEVIPKAINNICEFRAIMASMNASDEYRFLLEKINNSLEGKDTYDELKKKDIDLIIEEFKKLQEKMDGGL